MATQKSSTPNGGRATLRDVMNVVTGLHQRIDATNERIDESVVTQHHTLSELVEIHSTVRALRETANERLHDIEGDVLMLKRPWVFLAHGWTRSVALAGVVAGLSGTIMRLELWRFIPGL